MSDRCHLRGSVYAEPCTCHEYRGAVRHAVHAKALREHRKSDRECREEQEVFDRDEAAVLRAAWNRARHARAKLDSAAST